MIGTDGAKNVKNTVKLPDILKLESKNSQELINMSITQVEWNDNHSIGFTLNDGQSCKAKAGPNSFPYRYTFDPSKKITKVEVIINKSEWWIIRINFYHH